MSVYKNPSSAHASHPDGVSPIIAPVSPQSTGLAASNPSIISPQITGVTTAAPAYTPTPAPHPSAESPEAHQQPQTETHTYPETKPEAQAYQGIEVVSPSYNMDPNANPHINPNPNPNPNPDSNGFYDDSKTTHPPPQQGQYPQGAVPPQQQGRNQYATAMPLRSLQSGPCPVDCPVCGVREVTAVEYVSGSTAHLSALLCCIVTCLGCIPYMVSAFKDVEHKCGHCGTLLAIWHRSGRTEVRVNAVN